MEKDLPPIFCIMRLKMNSLMMNRNSRPRESIFPFNIVSNILSVFSGNNLRLISMQGKRIPMLWFGTKESQAKRVDLLFPPSLSCFLVPGLLPPVGLSLNITSLEGFP